MDLVDDEHAEASLGRGILHLINDGPDIVDTVVGRRIQLGHIEIGLRLNGPAGRTLSAGITVVLVFTVGRTRKNTGDRRLTRSACPAEQVAVSDSPGDDLVF